MEPTAVKPAVAMMASCPGAGTDDAPNREIAGKPTRPMQAEISEMRLSFRVRDANGPSYITSDTLWSWDCSDPSNEASLLLNVRALRWCHKTC